MRSGLIDNSVSRYRRRSAPFPRHNEDDDHTFSREVKQEREVFAVGHPRALSSKLVEEWVTHRLDCAQTCLGSVLEQF